MLAAFLLGRCRGGESAMPAVVETRDTVVVRETLRVSTPLPVRHYVRVTDTVRLAVTDTVTLRDTLWVSLPREVREYRDTVYRAVVSGIQPSLDTLEVLGASRVVTRTVRVPVADSRRWGIGISAGVGAGISGGKVVAVPYIGAGVTYTLVRVGER